MRQITTARAIWLRGVTSPYPTAHHDRHVHTITTTGHAPDAVAMAAVMSWLRTRGERGGDVVEAVEPRKGLGLEPIELVANVLL